MAKHRRTDEQGQALIVAVLLMVGLLVAAGLALDGGIAFLERRRMQNAADAAVVAGARDLTMADKAWIDDDVILGTVHHYAQVNGVRDPENNVMADYVDKHGSILADVGGGSIPPDATGISVTVQIERPSRFVHLVGINTVPASAPSLAQTGPPDMSKGVSPGEGVSPGPTGPDDVLPGIRPFGVPTDLFDDIDNGDTFTVHFGNQNQCGPEFENNVCTIEYTMNDGETKSQAHRGWWNFTHIDTEGCSSTGGANDLKEWMASGWRNWIYGGNQVCSKPGTDSSVFDASPVGSIVYIPIYSCVSDGQYHVAGITAVKILVSNKSGNDKYITAQLMDAVIAGNGQTIPDAIASFNVKMITLWQ
jgi:hypothetical protein